MLINCYEDPFVLQVGSASIERRLDRIAAVLDDLFAPAGVLLRGDSPSCRREGFATEVEDLYGEVPEGVAVREVSVRYHGTPLNGTKNRRLSRPAGESPRRRGAYTTALLRSTLRVVSICSPDPYRVWLLAYD